jgi:uncharacterized protein DUF6976
MPAMKSTTAVKSIPVENSMMTIEEASALIQSGARLFVSGDEHLLIRLPRGQWIGGTIPYFMSEDGGLCVHDKVQVAVMPDFVTDATVRLYPPDELYRIPADYKPNGFSYILIPAFSDAHQRFAKECSSWSGIFDRPLVGWIAGIDLKDLGKATPKVVDGNTGEVSDSKAAVMHIDLPADRYAQANIINLFHQGHGDTITFPSAGFEATDCFVNGRKQSFSAYVEDMKINIQQPLVASYLGAMVNVSFQAVDAKTGKVSFYAPVFPGVEYKIADAVGDYEAGFRKELLKHDVEPIFTCNCILNYLYANLEGKKTGHIVGPMTFGEIAYMLLNQTLVYLTIEEK